MTSLRFGTFSHIATRRSATRALASYHRHDGSLALPCLAAFLLCAPALVTRPSLAKCRPQNHEQTHHNLQQCTIHHCNPSSESTL